MKSWSEIDIDFSQALGGLKGRGGGPNRVTKPELGGLGKQFRLTRLRFLKAYCFYANIIMYNAPNELRMIAEQLC